MHRELIIRAPRLGRLLHSAVPTEKTIMATANHSRYETENFTYQSSY